MKKVFPDAAKHWARRKLRKTRVYFISRAWKKAFNFYGQLWHAFIISFTSNKPTHKVHILTCCICKQPLVVFRWLFARKCLQLLLLWGKITNAWKNETQAKWHYAQEGDYGDTLRKDEKNKWLYVVTQHTTGKQRVTSTPHTFSSNGCNIVSTCSSFFGRIL